MTMKVVSMGNLNTAVIGEKGYGSNIGKKGTSTDITFYNLKRGHDTVTIVEPSRYPDKFSSLFFALSEADVVILVVNEIDAAFGEVVLTADALGKRSGIIILKNYHTEDEIRPFLEGTVTAGYKINGDDTIKLRETLVEMAAKKGQNAQVDNGEGYVPIDHFFNVKGVGTVILGTVMSGIIRKHDDLRAYPTEKKAHVRSIQKHDDDFDEAAAGDRVGLALKNITTDELDRGYVLSSADLNVLWDLEVILSPNRFWKRPIEAGNVLHIGHWMQFVPARVESSNREGANYRLSLKLEKPLIVPEHPSLLVSHLDAGKLRVIGATSTENI